MNCPACGSLMTEEDFGPAEVDVCRSGCGSLWFDWKELAHLDESHEGAGAALRAALANPRDNLEGRAALPCPRCQHPMFEHLYSHAKEVNVDECYHCGGFFLDSGELRHIRETFMSEAEREAYRTKLLQELPEYGRERSNAEREKERTAAVLQLTKFLRLSYWIGGIE